MNNRTKILSVFLALLLAVGVVAVTPLSASAAEAEAAPTAATIDQAYPDFKYDVRYDGTAEITRYTGEGGDVTIPSTLGGYTVTSIGRHAFFGCTSLTSVTIPDSVMSIGDSAFYQCTGLTSIDIPDSVTSIGGSAFAWCTGLTSVTIPDSVTSIGGFAFYQCTGLTSVIIGDSVTSIGYDAFADCTSLMYVTLGDSVTNIESRAFGNTPWLENLYNSQPDGLIYAGKVLMGVKGNCPDDIIIKPGTVGIAEGAFGYENLKSISFPDSLKRIGSSAFYGCTGLTNIDIPDSVIGIGSSAFVGCTNLRDIKFPDTLSDIGLRVFHKTAWYDSQPDGLVYIGKVLYDVKGTCPEKVEILPGTISIAGGAFGGCSTLKSITIPDSVLTIGIYAFEGCPELKSVVIPKTVISIGDLAFGVDIYADGYIIIKGFKLYGYKGSEAEHYSKGVKITFVPLDETTPSEDHNDFSYAFVSDGTIEITGYNGADSDITIPSSIYGYAVTGIGRGAFRNYTSLTSVTIPNSVTSIGEFAFYGCTSLMSIDIPDSVTSIGFEAFGYYHDDDGNALKVNSFTIYGYPGSEAERYAVDNDFTFVPIKATPDESTPDEATPDESTPDEATPDEATPDEATPDEATPDEATPDEATPDEAILGDVDGDGEVNVNDATYIQRKIADIAIPFEIDDAAADADGDGQVTLMDATYIQRWLIKLKSNDNISKPVIPTDDGGGHGSSEKVEISRQDFPDRDGSGHGYIIISYSDGSVAYDDY